MAFSATDCESRVVWEGSRGDRSQFWPDAAPILWQSGGMEWRASDLGTLFAMCFEGDYQTVLQGDGEEPLYLPSKDPTTSPHRVVYRADYFASALHEVSHWCLAGAERRAREDYGYWYSPDGRSAEKQEEFERAEARPQALESLFAEACGFEFHLSADNLDGGVGPSGRFAKSVDVQRKNFAEHGLPDRAARFHAALARAFRPTE